MRTQKLCKACGSQCREDYRRGRLQVQCTSCEGAGCAACEAGRIMIDKCPSEIIGRDMQQVINYVGFAERGFMPEMGGALDQSQYFLNVFSRMQSEITEIQAEDNKKHLSSNKKRRTRGR